MSAKDTQPIVAEPVLKVRLLTEAELIDPNLSDKAISEVFYRGLWQELKYLKNNPKLDGHDDAVWPFVAKDYEVNVGPWYPVGLILIVMGFNFILNVYSQSYSLIFALLGLLYITYVIPILNKLKEMNRVALLDRLLAKSPFDKNLFIEVDPNDPNT